MGLSHRCVRGDEALRVLSCPHLSPLVSASLADRTLSTPSASSLLSAEDFTSPAPFPINLGQSAYAGGSFTEPRACTQPRSSRRDPFASHGPRRAAGTAGSRGRRPSAAAGAEVRGWRCAALRARGWGRSCIAGERRARPRSGRRRGTAEPGRRVAVRGALRCTRCPQGEQRCAGGVGL